MIFRPSLFYVSLDSPYTDPEYAKRENWWYKGYPKKMH